MKSLEDMNSVMVEYVSGMRVIRRSTWEAVRSSASVRPWTTKHAVWCEIARRTGPGFAAYVIVIEAGLLIMVPMGALMLVNGAIDASTYLAVAPSWGVALPDRVQLYRTSPTSCRRPPQAPSVSRSSSSARIRGRASRFRRHLDHARRRSSPTAARVPRRCCTTSRSRWPRRRGLPSWAVRLRASRPHPAGGRFYDVTAGTVSIGGVDVRDIDYDDLLAHVSVVFQKTFLTSGTILEHPHGVGRPLEEVRAAARRAQADDFITALPKAMIPIGRWGGSSPAASGSVSPSPAPS